MLSKERHQTATGPMFVESTPLSKLAVSMVKPWSVRQKWVQLLADQGQVTDALNIDLSLFNAEVLRQRPVRIPSLWHDVFDLEF